MIRAFGLHPDQIPWKRADSVDESGVAEVWTSGFDVGSLEVVLPPGLHVAERPLVKLSNKFDALSVDDDEDVYIGTLAVVMPTQANNEIRRTRQKPKVVSASKGKVNVD